MILLSTWRKAPKSIWAYQAPIRHLSGTYQAPIRHLSGTYQAPIRHLSLSLCVGVTWERQVLGIKHVEGIVPFTLDFLHSHSSRLARVLLGNGMNQALDAVPKCWWLGGWVDGWMDGCLDPMMTFLRGIG